MHDTATPFEGICAPQTRVWDRFVRVFHWALVASVSLALATGFLLDASWIRLHLGSGLLAVALVAGRIVWGFTGPTYARFSQFVPGPRDVIAHLNPGGRHRRFLGHNPAGALMVLALIGIILVLGLTGIAVLGAALKTGPLAADLPAARAPFWLETHEIAGLVLLALVGLHLGGVVFESLRSAENLARSMVTGRKQIRDGDLIAPPRSAHLLLAAALIAGVAIVATGSGAWMMQRPLPAPPVADVPAGYAADCAACHMGYHPSLRPAASWTLMMAGLGDHFGEDASLPAETTGEIAAWLTAHAAETVDSRPAALWGDLAETAPVALPDTRAWQGLHAGLDDAVFQRRTVYSRANCAACHRDAETGWFSPFSIAIPKETRE